MAISVGSVSVSVVPNAEEFRARMDELTRDQTVKVRLDVDQGTIDQLRNLLNGLGNGGGGGGSAPSGPTGGGPGALGALTSGFAGLSAPMQAVISLAPLIPPLLGGITTGVVALASSFTIAGLAVGGFAAVAMPLINDATTANQKLLAAQVAVNNATTTSGRDQALARQAALIAQLGPSTIALADAMEKLQTQWHAFAEGFQPELLMLFQTASQSLATILPIITPVIAAGAIAVNLVAKEFVAAISSPAGREFFTWVANQAGPVILTFADIFLKLGFAVIKIFEAFTPLTNLFIAGLDKIATGIAKWADGLANSVGFQRFIAYMIQTGPPLLDILVQLGKLVFGVLLALAPFAPVWEQLILIMLRAANVLLTALLPAFEWFGKLLSSHPVIIQAFANALLLPITGLAWLAENFRMVASVAIEAFGHILNGIADFVNVLLKAFGAVLHGASDAFGWIPGIGSGLKDASNSFDDFAAHAVADLHASANAALAFGTALAIAHLGAGGAPGPASSTTGFSSLGAPQNPAATGTGLDLSGYLSQFNSLMKDFKLGTGSAPSALSGVPGGSVGGGAGTQASQNLAAALLFLQGTNLGNALYQGVATGINPLSATFSTLTSNLTGNAQQIAQQLSTIFSTAMSFGQAAIKSLGVNVATGQGLPQFGTITNVSFDAQGNRRDQVQSQTLQGLQGALAQDKTFIADLAKAATAGLSADIRNQFIGAGPSSDATLASILRGDTGSIAEINKAFGGTNAQAQSYGQQVAQTSYLAQLVELQKETLVAAHAAPAATGAHVTAGLNTTAKNAAHAAKTTPSRGALSRAF